MKATLNQYVWFTLIKMKLVRYALVILIALASSAYADNRPDKGLRSSESPNNCSQDLPLVERMICEDEELSFLDWKLNNHLKYIDLAVNDVLQSKTDNKKTRWVRYMLRLKENLLSWLDERAHWVNNPGFFSNRLEDQSMYLDFSYYVLYCLADNPPDKCIEGLDEYYKVCIKQGFLTDKGITKCLYKKAEIWDLVGETEREIFWETSRLVTDTKRATAQKQFEKSDQEWREAISDHCSSMLSVDDLDIDESRANCFVSRYLERARIFYELNTAH